MLAGIIKVKKFYMDDIIAITPTILYILITVLVVLKLVLFFTRTSYRTLKHFIYFRTNNIYNSSTVKSKKAKLLQNGLTIAIVIAGVVALLTSMLIKQ